MTSHQSCHLSEAFRALRRRHISLSHSLLRVASSSPFRSWGNRGGRVRGVIFPGPRPTQDPKTPASSAPPPVPAGTEASASQTTAALRLGHTARFGPAQASRLLCPFSPRWCRRATSPPSCASPCHTLLKTLQGCLRLQEEFQDSYSGIQGWARAALCPADSPAP